MTTHITHTHSGVNTLLQRIAEYNDLEINTFQYTEHHSQDIENDIDPENNFFLNINNNCYYYTDDQFNSTIKNENKISIIHFNCRSMYANFHNIKHYLSQFKQPFNLIAISETWINSDRGMDFEIEGYELTCINRENKNGGGVALYVDKNLNYKVVEEMSTVVDNLLECVTIEICLEKKKNMIVSCIYRAPGSNIDIFKDWMEEKIGKINQKVMFICGDFNIDLLNPNKHKMTEEFINALYSLSLYPKITRPSRITSHCATLIDNIFTNDIDNTTVSGLLINDISDHLPVFTVYDSNYTKNKQNNNLTYRRVRTEESMEALKNDLIAQNWEIVYKEKDTDKAYDEFVRIFKNLYDKHCPIKQSRSKWKYIDSPWISKGLQNACKKKNTLYREFIKHRTKVAENKYKKYKNKLTNIMRICKKEYYCKILENNKNNIKKIWNILNSIIRNGTRQVNYPQYFIDNDKNINNMDDVVNSFNNFFVNVGLNLAQKIPNVTTDDINDHLIEQNPSSMFLKAVDEKEIIDVVNKCKNKMSTDFHDINMKIVKKVLHGISKPLTHIFNLSFQTGQFPNTMKIAKVIPLYKTGDKHHFTNYRPVSLLPQFSKILEKIFNDRLEHFIDKHKLITESQYGFRTNRSTSMAVTELIEEITNSIDQKKYAVGVFIDLKKAFDTINHDILISKLERYGIRGVVLNWIRSYLKNRQQFVKMGEHKSECLDIVCGVPQGSVLGPKLFIMYINDICKVSEILKFVLFADDTNIFGSGENLQQLLDLITSEFIKIKKWFDKNKLSLNLSKTKIMLFGKNKTNTQIQVQIDGIIIERVFDNKFLGVIIDDKICWKPHIRHVQSKLSRSISVLAKAKHALDHKSLHILYCSLILPYLNYCSEIWGNTYKSTLQPLVILQKRAIRIVHNVKFREHTNILFLKSKMLKLFDLVEFKTAQFMYKARYRLLSGNIQNMFYEREGGYNLRGELNFKYLSVCTTMKKYCISICGVKLWNSLHVKLKQCSNIIQFKKIYKDMILTKYRDEEGL